MTAALYLRVSLQRQVEGLSLDQQEQACRRAAETAGAVQIDVYREEGQSAATLNRTQLQLLLARLSDYDTLFVWRIDRLVRGDLADWALLMRACAENGVRLVSVGEGINLDDPDGEFRADLSAILSRRERKVIVERTVASQSYRVETLGLPMGRPPFGWRFTGKRTPPEPHPEEVAIVQRIFALFAQGQGLFAIAKLLNAEGVPSPRGSVWRHTNVAKILHNPAHVGLLRYRGQTFEGQQAPLIDPAVWERVQARLTYNREVHPKARGRSLAPVLRCGACGSHVGPRWVRDRFDYRCADRLLKPIPQRHKAGSVASSKVDAAIWRHAEELLSGGLEEALRRLPAEGGLEEADLRRRLLEIEAALGRYADALEIGALEAAMVGERTKPLLAESDRIAKRLQDLSATGEMERLLAEVGEITPARFLATLRAEPVDLQLLFLRALFQEVRMGKDAATFVYRVPGIPASVVAYAP